MNEVSDTEKISWDNTFKLSIYEFFNVVSYLAWKSNREKEQIQKYKNKRAYGNI